MATPPSLEGCVLTRAFLHRCRFSLPPGRLPLGDAGRPLETPYGAKRLNSRLVRILADKHPQRAGKQRADKASQRGALMQCRCRTANGPRSWPASAPASESGVRQLSSAESEDAYRGTTEHSRNKKDSLRHKSL